MKKPYIDPAETSGLDRAMLRRIVGYLRPYAGAAIGVVALIVVIALLDIVPAWLTKELINRAIKHGDLTLLVQLAAAMAVAPLAADLLGVARKLIAAWIAQGVMRDLRVQLFRHLGDESLGFFARLRPGEAVSRVLSDVEGVGSVVETTLFSIVDDSVVLVTTAIALLLLDWRLALIGMAVLPLFVLPTRRVGRQRKAIKRQAQAARAEMTGILTETLSLSGTLLMKVFGAEEGQTRRFAGKADEVVDLAMRQVRVGQQYRLLVGLFKTLAPALVFGIGGYLIIVGRGLDVGTLVAFVPLLKRLYGPASSLTGIHVEVVVSQAYFERIFEVLDHEPEVRSPARPVHLRRVRGVVRMDGVSYAYADGDEVLRDIDLVLRPGRTLAVVGPSGAGKSTLAGLVPRLYDPTRGAVLLDDHDLRALDLSELRARVAVVTQETYLLHATVEENLRLARPGATDAEVRAAARAAQIDDLIRSLPEGYRTVCGDRGHRFSGGERQRLSIARALLKDPGILVLDEATSSLDVEAEALVQAALETLSEGRTVLVIAHRLSTVAGADEILVLEAGRIVERGTHAALSSAGGRFAAMYREQAAARPGPVADRRARRASVG